MYKRKTILIAGSRKMSNEMAAIVRVMVQRVWFAGHRIIVGDAHGVDLEVVRWCEQLNVPYLCYTPFKNPRNRAKKFISVERELKRSGMTERSAFYSMRDKMMVDEADEVICISRPEWTKGTEGVYNYAKWKKKPVTMRTELKIKQMTNQSEELF